MYALDQLVHAPRLFETDTVEIAAPAARVWQAVRHGELVGAPLTRALFAARGLAQRVMGQEPSSASIRIDALQSTPSQPGVCLLLEYPGFELALGAIFDSGGGWRTPLELRHVGDAGAFAAFSESGFVKLVLGLQVTQLSDESTCLSCELRVDATSQDAWQEIEQRFRLVGPAFRLLRQSALAQLKSRLTGALAGVAPGDGLLSDAVAEVDHETIIQASPAEVWPWLVQLGCGRAGFYSIDALDPDKAAACSARELHPAWQALEPGDVIATTPDQGSHFEVLRLDKERALVLGALFDTRAHLRLRFDAARPEQFWQVTWAFVLEPLAGGMTRVRVRARAACGGEGLLHATWLRPVHYVMETAQLQNLRARVEQQLGQGDKQDVHHVLDSLAGLGGAARIALELLTPVSAQRHAYWGIDHDSAERSFPGDELVREPRWGWTHAIDIGASAERVWPWIAQIGAKHGGFYSYQWLENLVGCGARDTKDAETLHPEWEVKLGDEFSVHPRTPPLRIAALEPGRWFVAYAATGAHRDPRQAWVSLSWLFMLEPRGSDGCRLVSRYRCDYSDDLRSRLSYGQVLLRPIGYAMDRRMLEGIRERAERAPVVQQKTA